MHYGSTSPTDMAFWQARAIYIPMIQMKAQTKSSTDLDVIHSTKRMRPCEHKRLKLFGTHEHGYGNKHLLFSCGLIVQVV